MHSLSVSDTKKFVRFVARDQNEPVMLWGQPGVGKSEMMAQVASEDEDDILIDIRLSQYDSVDLRGFPGVEAKTKLTTWYAPSTLPFVGNKVFAACTGTIWLFLDEINAAFPATAAVAYQLVNDRCVGEHTLLPNVRIVCAGNRETDKGITNKQPLPLSNRLVHVEVIVSVDDFCYYQQRKGVIPPIAIAFYQFRRELLNTFDPSQPGQKAFSTPRTAEKAWKFWASDAPLLIKNAAMAGAIGDGPAVEALAFTTIWDTLKDYMPRILKDPEGVELPKNVRDDTGKEIPDSALGMRYAVTLALSGEMTQKNAMVIHTYLCRLDPEFVSMAWQFATRRDDTLYASPAFLDFCKRYRDVFKR